MRILLLVSLRFKPSKNHTIMKCDGRLVSPTTLMHNSCTKKFEFLFSAPHALLTFTFVVSFSSLIDTVSHLGHLLHYNFSDTEDVNSKLRDVVRKANCLLATFPRVGPFIVTEFFNPTLCFLMALASGRLFRIMLKKLPIMLFSTAPKCCLLCY